MKDRTLNRAFPIVAAAIGQRFGIKVRVGGDQAYTTGDAIQLPGYDGDDPDYKDYAWGLLAHEAFHIRHSDFSIDYGRSVIRRRLCGAIEDVRIEHEGAREFPGTRLTIRRTIEKMIAQGKFKAHTELDHPGDILHGYVLKSLRARVLGQTALAPLVTESEKALKARFPKGAVIRLKGLLSEVPEGLTCERDCLSLADQILEMIEDEVRKEKEAEATSPASGSDSDRDDGADPEASGGGAGEENCRPESGNDETVDTNPDDGQAAQDTDRASPASGGAGSEQPNPDDDGLQPAGIDTAALETLLQQILGTEEDDLEQDVFEAVKEALRIDDAQVAPVCLPSGDDPRRNEAMGLALHRKVLGESGKIRAALQGVVQSHRRNRPIRKRCGQRIDSGQLHRLPAGETRVFLRQAHKVNPNTAIHLLVDRSDSMEYQAHDTAGRAMGARMPLALDASMALALALEGIPGVNPAITAFPGGDERSVYTVLRHGEKLRPNVGAFALTPGGSTPMAEAIWYAAASLCPCREPRKVVMVLTDGQPDDRLSTLDILARCQRSGIETVGIGLGIDVSHLYPKSIVINDLGELRARLFELAKDLLINP
jgi:cobalamin biosynthesis protein CobT